MLPTYCRVVCTHCYCLLYVNIQYVRMLEDVVLTPKQGVKQLADLGVRTHVITHTHIT